MQKRAGARKNAKRKRGRYKKDYDAKEAAIQKRGQYEKEANTKRARMTRDVETKKGHIRKEVDAKNRTEQTLRELFGERARLFAPPIHSVPRSINLSFLSCSPFFLFLFLSFSSFFFLFLSFSLDWICRHPLEVDPN